MKKILFCLTIVLSIHQGAQASNFRDKVLNFTAAGWDQVLNLTAVVIVAADDYLNESLIQHPQYYSYDEIMRQISDKEKRVYQDDIKYDGMRVQENHELVDSLQKFDLLKRKHDAENARLLQKQRACHPDSDVMPPLQISIDGNWIIPDEEQIAYERRQEQYKMEKIVILPPVRNSKLIVTQEK